jgi:hypothetical protein
MDGVPGMVTTTSTERPKWLVFKKEPSDGAVSQAWYALHESNGVGGLFVGPDAWTQAMGFVNEQIRRERERDDFLARVQANGATE